MESAGDDSKTYLQCFNTSCGLKFVESDNHDEACTYHEGKPYFHDGYKEWTCCKMKSRDFTTFMSFKGCTKGRHSNVRVVEESKPEAPEDSVETTAESQEKEQEEIFTPPPADLVETIPIVENANLANSAAVSNIVICTNCKQEQSTLDMDKPCLYHRGVQVFHDSLKFWSCCPHKKFTEFEDFQKLPPCAEASEHKLVVKIDTKENWFQAGSNVTIALYGLKGARLVEGKSMSTLTGANVLNVRLVNIDGFVIFENKWKLFDYVIAPRCKIMLNPSNVQIVLEKANKRVHWPTLTAKET